MRKPVTIFILLFLISSNTIAQEWHKGGTLHNKNLLEWKNASEKNKLATSGDWIVALFNKKRIPLGTLNDIKEKAKEIRKCTNNRINKFKSNNNLRGLKANEIAYKCMKDKKYF